MSFSTRPPLPFNTTTSPGAMGNGGTLPQLGVSIHELAKAPLNDEQTGVVRDIFTRSSRLDDVITGLGEAGVRFPDGVNPAQDRKVRDAIRMLPIHVLGRAREHREVPPTAATALGVPVRIFGFAHGIDKPKPAYTGEVLRYAEQLLEGEDTLFLAEEHFRSLLGDLDYTELDGMGRLLKDRTHLIFSLIKLGLTAAVAAKIGKLAAYVMDKDDSRHILTFPNAVHPECYDDAEDMHRNRFSIAEALHVAVPSALDHLSFEDPDDEVYAAEFNMLIVQWRSAYFAAAIFLCAGMMNDNLLPRKSSVLFLCGQAHEPEVAYFLNHPEDMLRFLKDPYEFRPNPQLSPGVIDSERGRQIAAEIDDFLGTEVVGALFRNGKVSP